MNFLSRIFGRPATQLVQDQAVLIYLDGQGLPEEVYADCDLMTLEEQLGHALGSGKLGVVDGNEVGADAEAMVRAIEPVLRAYPLCQGARVVVRHGAPGAEQREFFVTP